MSGPDPKASERQPSPIPAALTALRAYRVGEVLTLHEETRDGPEVEARVLAVRPDGEVLVEVPDCGACESRSVLEIIGERSNP
jgi:hypothetical protein